MKLHFTKEQCIKLIADEPDDMSCEAGILHPEAPLNRFIIDHGVLHDTLIGRHVAETSDSIAAEGPEKLRDYIFSLLCK